jgi:hypothetical protein
MKTYRVVQREVIISVFHIEADSKREARKMLTGELSEAVQEAMGYREEDTESLDTIEIVELKETE